MFAGEGMDYLKEKIFPECLDPHSTCMTNSKQITFFNWASEALICLFSILQKHKGQDFDPNISECHEKEEHLFKKI